MSKYLLAIDQGTTGNTALILSDDLTIISKVNKEFPQIFPKQGWVEHNPENIWSGIKSVVSEALNNANLSPEDIAAIGITNQRETTIVWDKITGKPVYNAIVWQCRRTTDYCEKLMKEGKEELIRNKTGLIIDPYFSGTKLRWILENVNGVRENAEKGKYIFGTIDTFLVYRLTNGKAHVTDVSNGSRTLLMNIHNLQWDDELLSLFNIPREMLPSIEPSSKIYGYTENLDFLPDGIPVAGIAGDQQAALFGQLCFATGEAKCTYGTGSFTLMNTGTKPVSSRYGLLTTVAWKLEGEDAYYALEGSAFIAGAAVQWLRDGLGLIKTAPEIEELAQKVEDSGGVIFVPALTGLGAPHWIPNARGIITGLNRGITAAHIARATLEGIALQNYEIIKAMEDDLGDNLKQLKVDGGASADNLLMQMQSDFLQSEIVRPKIIETTGLGAGLLAGLAVKMWDSKESVKSVWKEDKIFAPKMDMTLVEQKILKWKEAVEKA